MKKLPLKKVIHGIDVFCGAEAQEANERWYWDDESEGESVIFHDLDSFMARVKANVESFIQPPYQLKEIVFNEQDFLVTLVVERQETQEEIDAREAQRLKRKAAAHKRREAKKQKDLKLLAELKAKYESPSVKKIET